MKFMKEETKEQKDEIQTEGGLPDRADETLLGDEIGEEINNYVNFLNDLSSLLKKYNAEITASDEYPGYPECGEDIQICIEIGYRELRLGNYIDFNRLDKKLKNIDANFFT